MFQFAFGLAAARRLGTTFAFQDDQLRSRFELGPWARPSRRLGRAVRYRVARQLAPFPVVKVDTDLEPEPAEVLDRLRDHTEYSGFFQSAEFFRDAESEVRAALQPLRRFVDELHGRHAEILRRPYTCCHIRRTDYLDWDGGIALPGSWYRKALRTADPPPGTPIVFIGDDVNWAQVEFADLADARFEHGTDVVDLLLLMHASTVLVSNSSFAWWGAWLNERPGTRILAPRHWMGFRRGAEWPPAVLPPDWTQIEVEES